jgi:hypothetical protein
MKKTKRPIWVQNAVNEARKEAHQKVVERGQVQFRLDPEYMEDLLRLADEKGTGYGVLARMWVCERLEQERGKPATRYLPVEEIRQVVREEVQEALKPSKQKRKRAG